MSTELQHKMYNYEVNPPAGSWDKIAMDLDESHLTDKFPSILHSAVATPPGGAWDNIAATLGELHLSDQFPVTLYNIEATPPISAWGKIAASLEEKEIPVIGRGKRIPLFIRYAAAAIFIGAIAFAAITLFNNKQHTDGLASEEKNIPLKDTQTNTANSQNNIPAGKSAEQIEEARNDAALEASKNIYANVDIATRLRTNGFNEALFTAPATTIKSPQDIAPENTYRDLECSEVHNSLYASGNSAIDMASRYAMLMTPDGNIIRISKKLGNLVCCVSGEEQDDDCKDQLKKWRQKIADSPVAPSPGNFMDILSLLHTLKDSNL
jgi:hypothetical protein